jgi:ABC-type multidrug transport system permease subunit
MPIIGLFELVNIDKNNVSNEMIIVWLVFTIFIPILMVLTAYFVKKSIKERFIQAVGLKPFS